MNLVKSIYVFDSSCFLSAFEGSLMTYKELFEILDNLDANLFIPHTVYTEVKKFDPNRKFKEMFNSISIDTEIQTIKRKYNTLLEHNSYRNQTLKQNLSNLLSELDEIGQNVNNNAEKKINEYKEYVENNSFVHWIEQRSFLGLLGEELTVKDQIDFISEATIRFENAIPPGFKDKGKSSKDFSRYGDLFIWKEILRFSNDKSNEKSHIVFVTKDYKKDWWYNGEIHPVLQKEFREINNNDSTIQFVRFDDFTRDIKSLLPQVKIEHILIKESMVEVCDTFREYFLNLIPTNEYKAFKEINCFDTDLKISNANISNEKVIYELLIRFIYGSEDNYNIGRTNVDRVKIEFQLNKDNVLSGKIDNNTPIEVISKSNIGFSIGNVAYIRDKNGEITLDIEKDYYTDPYLKLSMAVLGMMYHEDVEVDQGLEDSVKKLLHILTDKESEVIRRRFGIFDGRSWTLEETGRRFGVGRERVRQIEAKALRKLRSNENIAEVEKYILKV